VTKLPHEIESYTSSDLWVWVKLPAYSNSARSIFMYYGNSAAEDQQDATDVWDSDYRFVQHLGENATDGGSSVVHQDSTIYGIDGQQQKNNSLGGVIGVGQYFDGDRSILTPDLINLDNINTDSWTAFSIEGWINVPAEGQYYPRILTKNNGTMPANTVLSFNLRDMGTGVFALDSVINTSESHTLETFTGGTGPHHIALTWNAGANPTYYVDGAPKTFVFDSGTNPISGTTLNDASANQNFVMGNLRATFTDTANVRTLKGTLDEMRFSSAARSANWIKASYTNQSYMANVSNAYGSLAEYVFLGGTVYSDEGTTPLSGASVNVLVKHGGTCRALGRRRQPEPTGIGDWPSILRQ
jgi:hypothetical protein